MSDTGLYSSLYSRICSFAELLDAVLISLKSGTNSLTNPQQQKLGKLLVSVDQTSSTDPYAQLLSVLLNDELCEWKNGWSDVGNMLLSNRIAPEAIDCLEAVARTLEHERAGVLARMRGRTR